MCKIDMDHNRIPVPVPIPSAAVSPPMGGLLCQGDKVWESCNYAGCGNIQGEGKDQYGEDCVAMDQCGGCQGIWYAAPCTPSKILAVAPITRKTIQRP